MEAHRLTGYEVWPLLQHRTGQPREAVRQLVFPHVARPGIPKENLEQPERRSLCGITKYRYHRRGYLELPRENLVPGADFHLTNEWFGADRADALREVLASQRFARMVDEKGWRGVRFKPVRLI